VSESIIIFRGVFNATKIKTKNAKVGDFTKVFDSEVLKNEKFRIMRDYDDFKLLAVDEIFQLSNRFIKSDESYFGTILNEKGYQYCDEFNYRLYNYDYVAIIEKNKILIRSLTEDEEYSTRIFDDVTVFLKGNFKIPDFKNLVLPFFT